MRVTHGDGFTDKQAEAFEGLLLGALQKTGHFKTVGRTDIAAMLTLEANQQSLGCHSDACAAQIGNALGTELVATGTLSKLGERTVVSLAVLDARTVTAVSRAQETLQRDDALPEAATSLASQVVRALWPNAADEVAAPGPRIDAAGTPRMGEDGMRVAFHIFDDNGITGACVLWRYKGEKNFRSEPMTSGAGAALFEARLPCSPDEPVEYRVVAADAQSLEQSVWPSRLETARMAPAPKSSATGSEPASSASPPLVVKLTVTARRAGQQSDVVLTGGEPLSEAAQVAFSVHTNMTAYVYLAERHRSGALDILFPSGMIETRNPVKPGETVRIPARNWFVVDNEDLGPETVMMLASPTPLQDLESSFARAAPGDQAGRDLLAAANDLPACHTRGLKLQGNENCRPKTRGLIMPKSEAGSDADSIRVSARRDDPVVFVPFEFEHVQKTE